MSKQKGTKEGKNIEYLVNHNSPSAMELVKKELPLLNY
jgi:hypothetical protein